MGDPTWFSTTSPDVSTMKRRRQFLGRLAAGLAAMAVGVPILAVGGWYFRKGLKRTVVRLAAPIARRTERISLPSLRQRLHDLEGAFGRIARDRKALAVALAFAYVGWVWFAMPLYFAGLAVGVHVDPLIVLFIVPASTLAGLTPSPGGL
ncbi:MAG: lysylphosphatidylglycerol synthase domain-containing protein, partial [Verrucomicrobiota bacterium]